MWLVFSFADNYLALTNYFRNLPACKKNRTFWIYFLEWNCIIIYNGSGKKLLGWAPARLGSMTGAGQWVGAWRRWSKGGRWKGDSEGFDHIWLGLGGKKNVSRSRNGDRRSDYKWLRRIRIRLDRDKKIYKLTRLSISF